MNYIKSVIKNRGALLTAPRNEPKKITITEEASDVEF
jgi:hypothetical protein